MSRNTETDLGDTPNKKYLVTTDYTDGSQVHEWYSLEIEAKKAVYDNRAEAKTNPYVIRVHGYKQMEA